MPFSAAMILIFPPLITATVLPGFADASVNDFAAASFGPTALAAASFVHIPAGTPHYAIAETESVVQINGVGPFDVVYLNPKDDPRAQ